MISPWLALGLYHMLDRPMVTKSLQDRWIDEDFMTPTIDQPIASNGSLERCSYLILLMIYS